MNTSKKFKQDILKKNTFKKSKTLKDRFMKKVNQENDKQSSFWSKCNFELVEKEQIMAAMMMILSSVKEKKIARNLWV